MNNFAELLEMVGNIVTGGMSAIQGIVTFLTTDIGDSVLFSGLLQTILDRFDIIDLPEFSTGISILGLMSGVGIVVYMLYSFIKWILDIVL